MQLASSQLSGILDSSCPALWPCSPCGLGEAGDDKLVCHIAAAAAAEGIMLKKEGKPNYFLQI